MVALGCSRALPRRALWAQPKLAPVVTKIRPTEKFPFRLATGVLSAP
jgi:hypothetical protein